MVAFVPTVHQLLMISRPTRVSQGTIDESPDIIQQPSFSIDYLSVACHLMVEKCWVVKELDRKRVLSIHYCSDTSRYLGLFARKTLPSLGAKNLVEPIDVGTGAK